MKIISFLLAVLCAIAMSMVLAAMIILPLSVCGLAALIFAFISLAIGAVVLIILAFNENDRN